MKYNGAGVVVYNLISYLVVLSLFPLIRRMTLMFEKINFTNTFSQIKNVLLPCVSRIVAFIVKNIDTTIFLHVLLVNSILWNLKFRKKVKTQMLKSNLGLCLGWREYTYTYTYTCKCDCTCAYEGYNPWHTLYVYEQFLRHWAHYRFWQA